MNPIILDNIPFEPNVDNLLETLRLTNRKSAAQEFRKLAKEAREIAKPKALYGQMTIDSKGVNSVVMEGIEFTSNVLRVNVDDLETVYPALATCGLELEEWAKSLDNMLFAFWADAIRDQALSVAMTAAFVELSEKCQPRKTSIMSPGSPDDWQISEQSRLFTLFGNSAEKIGVSLTESYLMYPIKSVSGIVFASEEEFKSCQLCSQENCPKRRAPYDEHLFDQKYRIEACEEN